MRNKRRKSAIDPTRWEYREPEACFELLRSIRWPDGVTCCSGRKLYWLEKSGKWLCGDCGLRFPVTRGTLFDGSANWITAWFQAFGHLTAGWGCNARELQERLTLPDGSKMAYSTAHTWRRKICALFDAADDAFVADVHLEVVHVDQSSFDPSLPGRFVLAAMRANNFQRPGAERWPVRLASPADDTPKSILKATAAMIAPGAIVRTNTWGPLKALEQGGYRHRPEGPPGNSSFFVSDQGRRFAEELCAWLSGMFHGAIVELDPYLKEFACRWNAEFEIEKSDSLFLTMLRRTMPINDGVANLKGDL